MGFGFFFLTLGDFIHLDRRFFRREYAFSEENILRKRQSSAPAHSTIR
jgi:hypothetical protein